MTRASPQLYTLLSECGRTTRVAFFVGKTHTYIYICVQNKAPFVDSCHLVVTIVHCPLSVGWSSRSWLTLLFGSWQSMAVYDSLQSLECLQCLQNVSAFCGFQICQLRWAILVEPWNHLDGKPATAWLQAKASYLLEVQGHTAEGWVCGACPWSK